MVLRDLANIKTLSNDSAENSEANIKKFIHWFGVILIAQIVALVMFWIGFVYSALKGSQVNTYLQELC